MKPIIIVEGPDGGGKSTLVARLREVFRENDGPPPATIHHGPYLGKEEIATTYFGSMLPAYLNRRSVILDRSYISEPVYGNVYRGGANRITIAQRRILDRLAFACSAVVIVCLPPVETALASWAAKSAKGEEYLPKEEYAREVHAQYERLAAGTTDYFPTELPIITYDYTHESIDELLHKYNLARGRTNDGPGVGNFSEDSVLLVGDRPNVPKGVADRWRFPFGGMKKTGCSVWLANQLEEYSIGERSLYWINAYTAGGEPEDSSFVERLAPRKVIAFGVNAGTWCAENSISASITYHPQYWKRFRYNEPYPLFKEIKL